MIDRINNNNVLALFIYKKLQIGTTAGHTLYRQKYNILAGILGDPVI